MKLNARLESRYFAKSPLPISASLHVCLLFFWRSPSARFRSPSPPKCGRTRKDSARKEVLAWFKKRPFRMTPSGASRPLASGGISLKKEARSMQSLGACISSGAQWLRLAQPQQREPIRALFPCHQLTRTLALAINLATHEAPVIQEELQQGQVRAPKVAAREIRAQPRRLKKWDASIDWPPLFRISCVTLL